ncbi:hypothetical protein [Streptomyces sp. NPDC059452]|uniref:hypothetical protein n=1 Tax=Streptomyces sp. NPDC059452 TaxID=3346835 RepID=UPI0036756A51
MTLGAVDRGEGQRPVRGACELCGSVLAAGPATDRPRKFCGEACRQTAHRRRLCATPTAQPAAPRPTPTGSASTGCAVTDIAGTGSAVTGVASACVVGERRFVAPFRGPSEESVAELARSVREHAHDLVRRLPSVDDEEALRRVAQLREQLDGLTAAVIGRACGFSAAGRSVVPRPGGQHALRELREPGT